jgi:hypothetical protein
MKKPFPGALQLVSMVAKCGESIDEGVQLAIVKTLLTAATAEHFLVHGDSLVQVHPPGL